MPLDARIDARRLKPEELFMKLKEILESKMGMNVLIEILLDRHSAAKKVRAFVSMTGCQTELEEKDGYYVMRVTGSPCCV